ncbi:hypothetical protein NEISICOT_00784 [Neisseria sicca ATCC 29256]|uniref:Uncharacterized protein n=1 Tax=Neisseria sicca ATCC 29256 TaxID=547045 RepID=C6M2P4_NEISI|nr:hypothetical protein NEISICOT_00784 [Neisseria sicca ATCC 29256]
MLIPNHTQSAATAGVANPNANTAKHNIFFMSAPFVLVNKIKLNCKKIKLNCKKEMTFFQETNIPSYYLTTVSDGIVSICTPPL